MLKQLMDKVGLTETLVTGGFFTPFLKIQNAQASSGR
jgi:hypothetical protein